MRSVPAIAAGREAFFAAGGIEAIVHSDTRVVGKCAMCGEWEDGTRAEISAWGMTHAMVHDVFRPAVLGLDTSLVSAGIAVSSLNPADGLFWPDFLASPGETGGAKDTYEMRGRRQARQIEAILGYVDACIAAGAVFKCAAIEGPSYGQSSMPSYYDRAGLWWAVVLGLQARSIPFAVVTPDHRAKFICGVKPPMGKDRDRGKTLIKDETKARWRPLADTMPEALAAALNRINADQADALGLCEMAVLGVGGKPPWRPGRRHVENVHLTTWPAVTR